MKKTLFASLVLTMVSVAASAGIDYPSDIIKYKLALKSDISSATGAVDRAFTTNLVGATSNAFVAADGVVLSNSYARSTAVSNAVAPGAAAGLTAVQTITLNGTNYNGTNVVLTLTAAALGFASNEIPWRLTGRQETNGYFLDVVYTNAEVKLLP